MNDDDIYSQVSEPIAVVRKRHLIICDNDMCAAMLLDQFYANFATDLEWSRCVVQSDEDEEDNGHTHTTIKKLTKKLFDMFEIDQVTESLVFLQDKGYIEALVTDDNENLDIIHRSIDVSCNWKSVREACIQYDAVFTNYSKSQIDTTEVPETPEIDVPVAITYPKYTKEDRIKREREIVTKNNRRATRVRLSGTLTLDQWITALDHFNWRCAYCVDGSYDVLEHFIPIVHGGGTTIDNCVPACNNCNAQKSSTNPLASFGLDLTHMKEKLDRVQAYFDSLTSNTPTIIESNAAQR